MSDKMKLKLLKDGKVDGLGYDEPLRILIKQTQKYVVIKTPGRKYWAARFEPWHYAKAEFRVFDVLGEKSCDDGLKILNCVEVVSFPVSGKERDWPERGL
jgi:hypothetical protein